MCESSGGAASIAREAQHLHDEQRVSLGGGEELVRITDALSGGPAGDLVVLQTSKREFARRVLPIPGSPTSTTSAP